MVDLTCAYLMFSMPTSGDERLLAFLLYNFCAFAMQMPMGLIADNLNRNEAVAATGLCLTCIAFLCRPLPIACAIVLGLGNCLYHVGGGTDVLGFDDKKQWMLGVFVSPGALGLFIGTLLAKEAHLPLPLGAGIVVLLSLAVIFMLHRIYSLKQLSGNAELCLKPRGNMPLLAILCLFLVVVLRSYVGVTLYTPWKDGGFLTTMALFALVLGKAAGGLLADRFGAIRTATVSLAMCGVLFLFSEQAVSGCFAIFLFNMTMPLTLFAMTKVFQGARGFAFGTLTFALFLGCVPQLLSLPIPFYGKTWIYTAEAAVSLVLLAVGLISCRRGRETHA